MITKAWDPRRKPGPWARVDWSHPLARDLRIHLIMAEGGGSTALDLVGRRLAAFTQGPSWAPGDMGSPAAKFAALLQVLQLPYAPDYRPTAALTLAAWMRPIGSLDLGGGSPYHYNKVAGIDYRYDGTYTPPFSAYGLDWAAASVPEVTFGVTIGQANYGVGAPGVNLAFNRSYFLSGTYSGSALKFYIDGSLTEAMSLSGAIDYGPGATIAPFSIGNVSDRILSIPGQPSQSMNGLIDDIRIWGRALSADEVLWLMNEPYAHVAPDDPSPPAIAYPVTTFKPAWVAAAFAATSGPT